MELPRGAVVDFKAPKGGLCHRNPPTLVMGQGPRGAVQQMSMFPPTHEGMYCGEFRPRPDTSGDLARTDAPPPGDRARLPGP